MFLLKINPYLDVKIRWIGIIILAINVVLTNSMMSLVAMASLIVTFIDYKKLTNILDILLLLLQFWELLYVVY